MNIIYIILLFCILLIINIKYDRKSYKYKKCVKFSNPLIKSIHIY